MRREHFHERVEGAGRRLHEGPAVAASTNLQPAPEISREEMSALAGKLGLKSEHFQSVGGNLWTGVFAITPQLALDWLTERNAQNRDPMRSQFEAIEHDITTGQWALTHQGIAFDREGRLVDGQHRLFGILEANAAVLMMVTLNVSSDATAVIDRHRSRRARDLLLFAGKRMTPFEEAVIRRSLLGMSSVTSSVTVPTIMAFLEAHRERLEWACGCFRTKVGGVAVAPVVAGTFRASFHVTKQDVVRLELFCEVLLKGVAKHDEDRPAVVLRDWLLSGTRRSSRRGAAGHDVYARTIRAIRAFLHRETLAKLYAASSDLYPLPGISGEGV